MGRSVDAESLNAVRGNMDASEYKEFIFGILFLKRLDDQFQEDQGRLRNEYTARKLKPDLIEKQLANPDKYDFFVPDLPGAALVLWQTFMSNPFWSGPEVSSGCRGQMG